MKLNQIHRSYTIDDTEVHVTLGDTVFWFAQDQKNNVPAVAIVTAFCQDNMVDLAYVAPLGSSAPLKALNGVCLITDERLSNPNYRKRGSWCPRGSWSALEIKE
jgi:hypothetical protein